ncbi:flavin reductase family protein [Corynebacterium sp. 320]|uniref:flavin reductase family protein n=1 Tax=Corynebacterium TaxID=1716 RepID=UPI00125CC8CF|nr:MULTISPECIES: flavin reductase family protein [Corynebacterium]KAB1503147.1 flavin reductase family protein [Corynebacterium sp. 320]KAB1550639.1 flavin reductase family protein [Corynebacterium sp. 321]KAB1551001.1 flavin reductase family protein [Corynebacterium sp. 319]KAB3526944.1 flavin reductase family protein [Corynebacterium sp. 250]KAB3538437.1 flavin reductase family protein [Corynebacterium sp. 366]
MTLIDSYAPARNTTRGLERISAHTWDFTPAPRTGTQPVDTTDTKALRRAFANVPTPLATAAALVDGRPVGMVLGSFVVHSLEPALVSVSIQTTSGTWPQLRNAGRIGLSILSENNRHVINNFYRPAHERFDSLDYITHGEAILFPDAALHITADVAEEVTVGDHVMAVLRVHDIHHASEEQLDKPRPLVFHQSEVTTAR